jgi:hypothetical protein
MFFRELPPTTIVKWDHQEWPELEPRISQPIDASRAQMPSARTENRRPVPHGLIGITTGKHTKVSKFVPIVNSGEAVVRRFPVFVIESLEITAKCLGMECSHFSDMVHT